MTTITATFDIPEGQDPEEFMYRMESELGISFDEFTEIPAPPKDTRPEPFYDDFRYNDAVLSVPNVRKDEIAVHGKVVVVAKADEFWGGAETRDYRSMIMTSPTWTELTEVLNAQMSVTRDFHHQFLEGIHTVGTVDDVKQIKLILGS